MNKSECKHYVRSKGGAKWSKRMAALWEQIQLKRGRKLGRDASPHRLRRIQVRRWMARG